MTYKAVNLLHLHQERMRQLDKFGKQDWPPEFWMTILMEEVGESARAVCEMKLLPAKAYADNYKEELIQVAAVALSALENFQEQENIANASSNG